MSEIEIVIDENAADQRFDRFLRKYCKAYPEVKLGDIFAWVRKGYVKVNGRKAKEKYRLKLGDEVKFLDSVGLGEKNPSLLLSQKEQKAKRVDKEKLKDWIVHEDEYWIGFDKPAGIVVHPGNKHWNDLSMNDYLYGYTGVDFHSDSTFKPSFGFRLDKDTSGVLIAAKTYEALQYLNETIRERRIKKNYMAVVSGKFPEYLDMNHPVEKYFDRKFGRSQMCVDKKKGMIARTEAWLERFIDHPELGPISLIKVKIHTGRMHQIRVHVAHEGFPVLGDLIYGSAALNRILYKRLKINRHLLHCWKYRFEGFGGQKELTFEAKIPQDFKKIFAI